VRGRGTRHIRWMGRREPTRENQGAMGRRWRERSSVDKWRWRARTTPRPLLTVPGAALLFCTWSPKSLSRRVEEAVRVHLNPGREAAADWTQSMPGMHAVDGCIWLSDQSTSSKIDHSDFAGTSVPSLPTPPHCGGTSRPRKRPLPQPLTSQCTSTRAQLFFTTAQKGTRSASKPPDSALLHLLCRSIAVPGPIHTVRSGKQPVIVRRLILN